MWYTSICYTSILYTSILYTSILYTSILFSNYFVVSLVTSKRYNFTKCIQNDFKMLFPRGKVRLEQNKHVFKDNY